MRRITIEHSDIGEHTIAPQALPAYEAKGWQQVADDVPVDEPADDDTES